MRALYVTFLLGLATCMAVGADAQTRSVDVSVRNNETAFAGNKLDVDFDIDISRLDLRANQGVVLTPVLQSDTQSKTLPAVVVNRRGRDIAYQRLIGRKGGMSLEDLPYAVIRMDNRSQAQIEYQLEIPFEAWMDDAQLLLRQSVSFCAHAPVHISDLVVAQDIGPSYSSSPLLTYLSADSGEDQIPLDSVQCVVLFPVGKATILADYAQNRQNIARLAAILTDSNLSVKDVKIVGAASPEGSYPFNEQLSEKRAQALASLLTSRYDVALKSDQVSWIGVDWPSLLEAVRESDMNDKGAVVDAIEAISDLSVRQSDLMEMNAGEPYRYMRTYFFPRLRRASCMIRYQPAPFDLARGRRLLDSNPDALTQGELLLVANSFPRSSAQYANAIAIAVTTYPASLVANIDASSVALRQGNTVLAKRYLDRVGDRSEAWNNLGVLHQMEGDNASAEKYFQLAVQSGSSEAAANLERMNARAQ